MAPLDAIPGVDQRTIEAVMAEIGVDMRPFPSDRHLTSWTGLCPGHHESAGKHTSGKTRQGNRWVRTTLTQAGVGRDSGERQPARYRRVMRHVAVAHTILVIIYYLLKDQVPYQELGATYLDPRNREHATRRHVKQLERLGHRVILEPVA